MIGALTGGILAAAASTSSPNQVLATNLTGHPALILPDGFREDGTPVSITFLGDLVGEAPILMLGHAYQLAAEFHRRQPPQWRGQERTARGTVTVSGRRAAFLTFRVLCSRTSAQMPLEQRGQIASTEAPIRVQFE